MLRDPTASQIIIAFTDAPYRPDFPSIFPWFPCHFHLVVIKQQRVEFYCIKIKFPFRCQIIYLVNHFHIVSKEDETRKEAFHIDKCL